MEANIRFADGCYQTESGVRQSADIIVHDGSESVPCSEIRCRDGFATLSNATGYCICPRWHKEDVCLVHLDFVDHRADIASLQNHAAISNVPTPPNFTTTM